MLEFNNLSQYSEQHLVDWLKKQDDLYENDGQAEVDDSIYDNVRRVAELSFPANVYFTGVGADVRGGKVVLPFIMSGLTQLYENDISGVAGVRDPSDYVVTDKLDGTSAQVIYNSDGEFQIAYSRGNGTFGADISRHIRMIQNIPKKLKVAPGRTLPVRMEIIIPKPLWANVKSMPRRNGETYKNARNAVAGIMNSSENDPLIYQNIRGVSYTVIDGDDNATKLQQLAKLQEYGFEVVKHTFVKKELMTESLLTKLVHERRGLSEYELDGVVVDFNEKDIDTKGYPSSFKYKVADGSNYAEAIVKDITWTPSKDGYLKPVINIQPVQLEGVTVGKCTGFNAKYISENQIQPGAVIRMTRSGQVIPFCLGVAKTGPHAGANYTNWFNQQLDSFGDWMWSQNNVDAILEDVTDNREVAVNLMTDIFTKLKIEHLRKGNIEKLYDRGYKNYIDILNLDYCDLSLILGEIGGKIDESFAERLNGIYWPEFIGSLNFFGRGISRRTLIALYEAFKGDVSKMHDVRQICSVEGFDLKTAQPIADKIALVEDTLKKINNSHLKIKTFDPNVGPIGEKMKGQQVVFTGVRSAEMEQLIVSQGGVIGSGVSSKTTIVCAKDPNDSSGKIKKAREINGDLVRAGKQPSIRIVDIKQLEKILLL
jgi:DNA ligase (NAD+)